MMIRWEYLCEILDTNEVLGFIDVLNKFGKLGWELVHCEFVSGALLIFKRPLRDDNG